MAEKPILFSGPMVRAILEGRKDVTRRLMNPQPPERKRFAPVEDQWAWYDPGFAGDHYPPEDCRKPRYRKGDLLWVKEAWRTISDWDDRKPSELPTNAPILYEAIEGGPLADVWGRYRHARFMCRWMSRLWVRVTEDPYPERVRDITEAEAIREGVMECDLGYYFDTFYPLRLTAVEAFHDGWNGIHGPESWERDWVWRYAFEFHADVPDECIDRVFAVMALAPQDGGPAWLRTARSNGRTRRGTR